MDEMTSVAHPRQTKATPLFSNTKMLLESFCFSHSSGDVVSGSCQSHSLETLSLCCRNQRLGFAALFKKLNCFSMEQSFQDNSS